MSRERLYFTESYCSHGHRQTEANTTIGNAGRRVCRICKATQNRRYQNGKQREEREISAAMNRQNKHGPELVRVPVKGWGCA